MFWKKHPYRWRGAVVGSILALITFITYKTSDFGPGGVGVIFVLLMIIPLGALLMQEFLLQLFKINTDFLYEVHCAAGFCLPEFTYVGIFVEYLLSFILFVCIGTLIGEIIHEITPKKKK